MMIEDILGILGRGLRQWGRSLDEVQQERFLRLTRLMLEWNERIRLTAITDPRRIAIEHYLDSVAPVAFGLVASGMSVVDVGTGAGFPGLPLAILCPEISVTLIEATRKKVTYLGMICQELHLTNVEVLWGRAEELGHQKGYREGFDAAIARAFGPLDVVLECTLPFVKVQGVAIAYKGRRVDEELPFGEKAASLLGGKMEVVHRFTLPEGGQNRSLVVVRKFALTPRRFPRRAGIPEKRPLGRFPDEKAVKNMV